MMNLLIILQENSEQLKFLYEKKKAKKTAKKKTNKFWVNVN
jgi:hypothetical protein